MTPIKVGEYTVVAASENFYRVLSPRGNVMVDDVLRVADGRTWTQQSGVFRNLPMALRFAAEMAGIERQRVVVADYTVGGFPVWVTYPPGEQADESGNLSKLMDRAHRYARELRDTGGAS